MAKLYDFGTDRQNISVNERKAFAWPVAVWSCYIPESESNDLNILERLILQLADIKTGRIEDFLCGQAGFHTELVHAAVNTCKVRGYLDPKGRLTEEGRKLVENSDKPYTADLEASKRNKKIYMIQDLVTKNVIPVFDIEKLPDFYEQDDGVIMVHYQDYNGKKPKSAAIRTALRYWAKLGYNRRQGIVSGSNKIPIAQEEDVQKEGPEDIKTFSDKEHEEEQAKASVASITILDDSPEVYYARGFIALDRNAPDEAVIVSPFGERLDGWFRTVISRLRASDKDLEEEIQLFMMEKKEELRDTVAFGNEMKIGLFDRFPFISNRKEFADLKRAIETLVRTRDRIIGGEDETHNYTENRATALQIALRHLIDSNSWLLQKKMRYEDYELAIRGLVNSCQLSRDIIRNYLPRERTIYHHMIQCDKSYGHITGYSALFLADAWNHRDGKSMKMLRKMPEFPQKIYEVTRPRNTSTHGKRGYAQMQVSEKKAVQGYEDFEEILTVLYEGFMEGA